MENQVQSKSNKQEQNKIKKVLNIALNVIFYAFILFLLCFAIANIAAKKKNNIPNIFGTGFMSVISDSMDGTKDDSFKIGDMIIVKLKNKNNLDKLEIEKSILVCYNVNQDRVITHRLVDISTDEFGNKLYWTQGDKVEVTNPSADYQTGSHNGYLCETYKEDEILAIYSGKIKGAGKVLTYLQSKEGFGLCIVLPTALLLLYQAYILIRNVLELNRQKLAKELEAKGLSQTTFDAEAEKQRIREELLAEMKREQEQNKEEDK